MYNSRKSDKDNQPVGANTLSLKFQNILIQKHFLIEWPAFCHEKDTSYYPGGLFGEDLPGVIFSIYYSNDKH